MSAQIYYDSDADLGVLKGKKIVFLGFGNQGAAQAQNLRDSGIPNEDILIANRKDSYADDAKAKGFIVEHDFSKAAPVADVLFLLIPDQVQPRVFNEGFAPHLKDDVVIVVASGYNVFYKLLNFKASQDVVMVAPRMIGSSVRSLYVKGKGFPCFVSVEQDGTTKALVTALALSLAIGATKAGAIASSAREETMMDLFAEQALWPNIIMLFREAFSVLKEAGCSDEALCYEMWMSKEPAEIFERAAEDGFIRQLKHHSTVSQFGQLSGALALDGSNARAHFKDILYNQVLNGKFCREFSKIEADLEKEGPENPLEELYRKSEASELGQAEKRTCNALSSWHPSRTECLLNLPHTGLLEIVLQIPTSLEGHTGHLPEKGGVTNEVTMTKSIFLVVVETGIMTGTDLGIGIETMNVIERDGAKGTGMVATEGIGPVDIAIGIEMTAKKTEGVKGEMILMKNIEMRGLRGNVPMRLWTTVYPPLLVRLVTAQGRLAEIIPPTADLEAGLIEVTAIPGIDTENHPHLVVAMATQVRVGFPILRITPPAGEEQEVRLHPESIRESPVYDAQQDDYHPEEPKEDDSEARSVFVSQLAARLTARDLGYFFEDKLGENTVMDSRIVTDRLSRRSKGIGYVEFRTIDLVEKAIALSGTVVMGLPIMVQLTEAERNRLHAGDGNLSLPPGVHAPHGAMQLYVGSLHFNLTESDIKQVFEPFGELEFVDLHKDPMTGRSKGYAFVQYKRAEDAKMALDQMDGFELAGRQLRVNTVHEKGTAKYATQDTLDEAGGGNLNAASRQALMQKLARTEPAFTLPEPAPKPITPAMQSRSVLLKNMFDPEEETERDWDKDLAEDVKGECQEKYGTVLAIKVEKDSQGEIYVKFDSVDSAKKAVQSLNGRWFGGKQVSATFISDAIMQAHQ